MKIKDSLEAVLVVKFFEVRKLNKLSLQNLQKSKVVARNPDASRIRTQEEEIHDTTFKGKEQEDNRDKADHYLFVVKRHF